MSPTNGSKSTSKGTKAMQTSLAKFLNSVVGARVVKTKAPPKEPVEPSRLIQQQLFAGLTAPTAAAYSPILHDGGQETIGLDDYQANVAVKILQKDSSEFFQGPIHHAPKGENGQAERDRYQQEAADYPLTTSSTVVRCKDGTPLLYFIKGAMFAGLSPQEQLDLASQSTSSIQELVAAYPPIPPGVKDSRIANHAEQRRKWRQKGKAWGRLHLMLQYVKGREAWGRMLHSHSQPKSPLRQQKLAKYVEATTWEHNQVSKWISVLDPAKYQQLHDRYQELGEKELKHMYQGPQACQSGLVLLVNVNVGPHKDTGDARDNWTTTNCWTKGKLKGGHIVFREIETKIEQEPGDLILTHAAVLTHFLEEIEEGERFCNVRFTKENILVPPQLGPKRSILCSVAGCKRSQLIDPLPSKEQLRKHIEGPPGQKAKLKAMGSGKNAYHFLEGEEAEEAYNTSMAEYEQRSGGLLETLSG